MIKSFFCCLLFLGSYFSSGDASTLAHEFHVSKCIIEYDEDQSSLQITLHIFIDDLETALAEQGAKQLFVGTEKEIETTNTYIERYINQGLELEVNQKEVEFKYLGKEISEDLSAVWCYLEVEKIKSLKELSVSNNMLMEVYNDQKNIISVTGPDEKKGYFLFVKGNSRDSVQF